MANVRAGLSSLVCLLVSFDHSWVKASRSGGYIVVAFRFLGASFGAPRSLVVN